MENQIIMMRLKDAMGNLDGILSFLNSGNQMGIIIKTIVAFLMMLWSLKIYKVLLVIVGLIVGATLGVAVDGAVYGINSGSFLFTVIFTIVGGLLAIPIQSLLIFLYSGGVFAFLVYSGFIAGNADSGSAVVFAILSFFVGGALTLFLFDKFFVMIFAFIAAINLLNIETYGANPLFHLITLLFILGCYIYWANSFQVSGKINKKLTMSAYRTNTYFKKLTLFFSGYAVLQSILTMFLPYNYNNTITTPTIYLGINIVALPVIVLLTSNFLDIFSRFERQKNYIQFLILMVFSIVVLPITASLFAASFTGFRHFGDYYIGYYQTFFMGNAVSLIIKYLVNLMLVPGSLFYCYRQLDLKYRLADPAESDFPGNEKAKAEQEHLKTYQIHAEKLMEKTKEIVSFIDVIEKEKRVKDISEEYFNSFKAVCQGYSELLDKQVIEDLKEMSKKKKTEKKLEWERILIKNINYNYSEKNTIIKYLNEIYKTGNKDKLYELEAFMMEK